MARFRSTILIAYCLVVLTAGLPVRGFSWCLREDGSFRLEVTRADGRCIDFGENSQSAPGQLPAYHVPAASLPCVDLTPGDGSLVASRTEGGAEWVLLPPHLPVQPTSSYGVAESADSKWQRQVAPPGRVLALVSDSAFIRKTVALLI